jgi:glutaredoxin
MDITVYYGRNCSACHEEMEFLKRNNIAFVGKDVTQDVEARRELLGLGSKTVPTTLIDGEMVVGFEMDRLKELLNL